MIGIRTASGRRIDLERLRGEDIDIHDIARGLSHCCRFAGQLPHFYSVAQHSVLVSQLVDPRVRLAALLHDASEAYMGDLSRNLKHHPLLQGYCEIEHDVQTTIESQYIGRVTPLQHRIVKAGDDLAACIECAVLRDGAAYCDVGDVRRMIEEGYIKGTDLETFGMLQHLPMGMVSWTSQAAETIFLNYFNHYRSERIQYGS